ncbi:RNA-guided endonuclease IscB [Burkholderia vietnamiensis]|uniref:RNA-guided endonuclease IscB n=1 Tax=Burkholderia vietnamiensis TaxID=60552 RepID=UPI001CF5C190|nr:RNA-guided endonuclease IscB [Burkholderia vietnamiensis]MCA8448960.1 HNH endonuclease [Burkholderia vietnamiensis]
MAVAVLDRRGNPLMPCTEKRARLLLARGRARVHRVVPFVIRLTDRLAEDSEFQALEVKLDPGSKTTGIAVVRVEAKQGGDEEKRLAVLVLINLVHRGRQISEALTTRRQLRRGRRGRNTRYRAPRFLNRGNKKEGWLAPSLYHRIQTTMSWVDRLSRWFPISSYAMERVKFDMQAMQNPEISGVEYQRGTLFGYELREYLLEKWNHACAYCDTKDVPLNLDHIVARARGGSNRVSNLVTACVPCNQKKGALPVEAFLKGKPDRLRKVLAQAKAPLRDAAAVNTTRNALLKTLQSFADGMIVETGTGGQTKYNRTRLGVPKDHALDAACVGTVESLTGWQRPTLVVKAMGRGQYRRTLVNASGFPRGYLMRQKQVKGFQSGDRVKAVVPSGKKQGTHVGRVTVRASGSFNITTATEVVQGISHKHCRVVQRGDGYGYSFQPTVSTDASRYTVKAQWCSTSPA